MVPPQAAWLSRPFQTPPAGAFLAPRPLPRLPGLPAPFPRRPSQCLILLQIPAEPTRPPPLPPSRPHQPRPHWARACSWCAPHPLLAQLARPRCSQEEAVAGVPEAPPALGPSREAGRPAPPDPPWVSASGGRRAEPLLAGAPGAGATPVIAPGPAGGRANISAAALGPERARGCSHLWAPAGAVPGLRLLGAAGGRAAPRTWSLPPRAQRRGALAG